jgi:hypothetical protein
MRASPLPQRPALDERIKIAIASDEKRRIFEAAASHGVTASELVRQALARALQAA